MGGLSVYYESILSVDANFQSREPEKDTTDHTNTLY